MSHIRGTPVTPNNVTEHTVQQQQQQQPPRNVSRTALDEMDDNGSFNRTDSAWRDWISQEGVINGTTKFPPAAGRYHIYVAAACPWANRVSIVRALKGLEDSISMTIVLPVWKRTKPNDPDDTHCGWVFADPNASSYNNSHGLGGPFPSYYPGITEPEPFFGCKSIRELYEKASDVDGKYTVPILWDKQLQTIVSNESSEIIQMLDSEFNDYAKNPTLDLNPSHLHQQMKHIDSIIYHDLNNGVYKCGFAQTQVAYDEAIENLSYAFDHVESILKEQRFIAGNQFTLSDVRLFVTLVRFDEVYAVYFKCNTRSVMRSETLLNYVREIYQMDGVKDTIYIDQIKLHYYASHPDINKYSIVPKGPNFEALLMEPHNRHLLEAVVKDAGKDNVNKKIKTMNVGNDTVEFNEETKLANNGWDAIFIG